MSTLHLLSLCTGIGGIDYAWSHLLGQSIIGQVELDPYCCAVLTKQWPNVPKYPDLKELTDADPFAEADLVAGGIPCQPYSLAGKRRGTADDRHLWPFAFALIARRQPTWVLLENVAGFIHLALDLVQADLESAGYTCQAYVLPACALGASHIRERVFVVAYSDSARQWIRQNQQERGSWCQGASDLSPHGTQGPLAAPHASRLQVGHRCPVQAWTPSATDRCSAGHAQPGMDRGSDGVSRWLDSTRWPALPGHPQHEWEPPRTVTGTVPHRAARLRALGNAIVPAHVYPILAAIVAIEAGRDTAPTVALGGWQTLHGSGEQSGEV